MKDLIEALTIFLKYGNPMFPTHCEHDYLYICVDVPPAEMEDLDVVRLYELHFVYDTTEYGDKSWYSGWYGSA